MAALNSAVSSPLRRDLLTVLGAGMGKVITESLPMQELNRVVSISRFISRAHKGILIPQVWRVTASLVKQAVQEGHLDTSTTAHHAAATLTPSSATCRRFDHRC